MTKKSTIVLVSDNHGQMKNIEYIREKHSDADYFIHCGDAVVPAYLLNDFAVVQGNCDSYNAFPARKILTIDGHRILVVHSHREMHGKQYPLLAEKAKSFGCDLVFFGHTHIPLDKTVKGVRLLNPGSVWHNRDGSAPSYMIVTIQGEKVSVKRMECDFEKSS